MNRPAHRSQGDGQLVLRHPRRRAVHASEIARDFRRHPDATFRSSPTATSSPTTSPANCATSATSRRWFRRGERDRQRRAPRRSHVYSKTMEGLENCLKHKVMTGVCTSLCQTNFDLSARSLGRPADRDGGDVHLVPHLSPVGPDANPELALTPEQQLRRAAVRGRDAGQEADRHHRRLLRRRRPRPLPAATGFTHHISPWGDIEPCPIIQFAKESIYDERPLREVVQQERLPARLPRAGRPTHTRGCIMLERPDLLSRGSPRHGARDTTARQRVDFLSLVDGRYELTPLEENRVFRTAVIPGFWLNVDWLLTRKTPAAYHCLQEILARQPEKKARKPRR
jgi:hypothetical protein